MKHICINRPLDRVFKERNILPAWTCPSRLPSMSNRNLYYFLKMKLKRAALTLRHRRKNLEVNLINISIEFIYYKWLFFPNSLLPRNRPYANEVTRRGHLPSGRRSKAGRSLAYAVRCANQTRWRLDNVSTLSSIFHEKKQGLSLTESRVLRVYTRAYFTSKMAVNDVMCNPSTH